MNEWINEKVLPPVLKFVNTKAITALRKWYVIHDALYDRRFDFSIISKLTN